MVKYTVLRVDPRFSIVPCRMITVSYHTTPPHATEPLSVVFNDSLFSLPRSINILCDTRPAKLASGCEPRSPHSAQREPRLCCSKPGVHQANGEIALVNKKLLQTVICAYGITAVMPARLEFPTLNSNPFASVAYGCCALFCECIACSMCALRLSKSYVIRPHDMI